ncbi:MAG: recombinase family protein [Muribaculum sp.]|nr:recombinase family protein [Muribaculum sp.]
MSDPKYCAYLRKSRADRDAELRGEGDVLARHRAMLEDLAARMGITLDEWYCEVVSGDTIADRPEMQRLLSDVEAGHFLGVLVVEVERLARGNTRDQGIVADAFKYSGTKIITPLKTYDPNDEFDEEYFEFGLYMARREYKTINRRLQRGRIRSVMEGRFVGGTAPYGYRKVKIPKEKGYTLEIVPEEAKIVSCIYEWYCSGLLLPDGSLRRLGPDGIARQLDLLGVKPPRQNVWSKATISDILRNIVYAGYVYFGRQKEVKSSVNGRIVKMRKSNPDYEIYKGLHPAIIPEETFRLAQEIRSGNRKNTLPAMQTLQNPLAGLVYCKKCGRLMTRLAPNSRNRYSTLKCPNRYCDNISAPLFLVEQELLRFLQAWLADYELHHADRDAVPFREEIAIQTESIRRLEEQTAGIRNQLNKTYDLLEQGIYTPQIFRERHDTLQAQIDAAEKTKRQLIRDVDKLNALRIEQEQLIPKIQGLLDAYQGNSPASNNRILKEIIERITYQKNAPNRRGQLHNTNFTLEVFPRIPT